MSPGTEVTQFPPEENDFHGYADESPRMGFPSSLAHWPMLIEQVADSVVVWAPAKVNLHLEVLARRSDGYHEIETLMVTVSLHDTLVFKEESSGEISLVCSDPALSTGPENLVQRAATLLQQRTGCRRGAFIQLIKRIPLSAGLAGGSTDAAAALAGLDRLWRLGLSRQELVQLAAELGSDVAFFLVSPAAWCTGRGERVSPLHPGRTIWLVLLCPPVGLSTAEVYRNVQVPSAPVPGEAIQQAFIHGQIEELGKRLHNRLQPAAEQLCPLLTQGLRELIRLGPAGAAMSGSGTSLFALCRDSRQALRLAQVFRGSPDHWPGWRIFVVRTES